MIYLDQTYQDSSKYQFPDRYVDPKDKKDEYCLKNAQAIYSTHVRNKSGIPYDVVPHWQNLRLYGSGLQNENQYINTLTGGEGSEAQSIIDVAAIDTETYNTRAERRKAWGNVNKQIISLAPKIKDHFYGMFIKQEHDVIANTIDEDSGALKENAKFRLLANSIFQKELALLRQNAGLPNPRQDFLPKDMTELELYESAGGFKRNEAMSMEKLLKHTFEISDWDNNIKKKLIDDAVDIGMIAVREDIDEDTGKNKVSYVDVCNLAVQYSTEFDYDDAEWQGYITWVNISTLRQKGFERDFLVKMAQKYSGVYGNPNYTSISGNNLGYNRYEYDAFKIPVWVSYWIDMDAEYEQVYTSPTGKKEIKSVSYGKTTDHARKEIKVSKKRKLYGCKWIIGSDEVYDAGKAYNQTFKDDKPIMPIRVVKITDNSITNRLRPVYDDMQMAWLKYQNAQIMAMNAGYAINVRLLNNIKLGGQKLTMKEVFNIMKDTGNLFYSDTTHMGKYEGGAVNPVTPLPGGMGIQLTEAIQKFEWAVRMIEHETGLTSLSMGATPRADQGKATTELSMAATQNVIRPIIDGIMNLKGRISENSMLRIQLLINSSKRARDGYTRVVGRKDIDVLKIAEGRAVSYGINLEPRATDAQKQWIMGLVNEAIALGRDGVKSMEIDDALNIVQQLDNGGNIKEMGIKLGYKIRKYKEEAQQKANQTIQLQSQEQQKAAAQKAQFEAQGKQADAQIASGASKQEHGQNMQVENLKSNSDFKLKAMDLAFKEEELESKERIAENNNKNTE